MNDRQKDELIKEIRKEIALRRNLALEFTGSELDRELLELIESNKDRVKFWVEQLITERGRLADFLLTLPFVRKVFPSDANFLLVSTDDPKGIYNHLIDKEIIVRDRSSVTLCEGCLRITVGTHDENVSLAEALKKFR